MQAFLRQTPGETDTTSLQPTGLQSAMILGQLVVAHLVILVTLPLWGEFAFDIGDEVGAAVFGGVLIAPASILLLATACLNGHWFVRISWATFVAALGVMAFVGGVKFQEGHVESDLAIAGSVIPVCIAILILLEAPARRWQRRRLALDAAGRRDFPLSLRQLFVGTALISISVGVPNLLISRGELQAVEPEQLLMLTASAALMLLVCLINSLIGLYWAFASRDLVILFVLLGPIYAAAVATCETLIVCLLAQSAEVLRVGALASVMIYSQCTVVMASLLYLRAQGFRLERV